MNRDGLLNLEQAYFRDIAHARQDYQRLMIDFEKDYLAQAEQARRDWYDVDMHAFIRAEYVDMPAFIAEYVEIVKASPFYVPL